MFKLVLSFVLGLAFAEASGFAPFGLAGLHAPWGAHLAAPVVAAPWVAHVAAPAVFAAPAIAAHNYRGPLSLAPGQPASILAHDGRPLDTLSVNVDRAAHYTAKAVDHAGGHWLKKRSAHLFAAPAAWSHAARVDFPASVVAPAAPLGLHAAPFGFHAAPLGLHATPVAPLGLGHLGHAGHLGHWW